MYSNTGVVEGYYSGQQDRVDELNDRIYSRYVPDNNLRPNYDPRPVSTKYAIFPVMDRRIPAQVPMKYSLGEDNNGFLPSVNNAPTIRNIDTETVLRNQTMALQNGIGQSVFVPSSKSDLYNTSIISRPSQQPFPGLFVAPVFSKNQPTIANQPIGKSDFFNFTRSQLRNTIIQ